jgi:acetyltransferase
VSAFSEKDFLGVTVQKMANLSGTYEIILGCSIDAQLGPVLLFGTGGIMVEVFKDSALAIPPLNEWSAQELMKQTKIFKALKGVRGRKSVNVDALCSQLVSFSRLITDNPRIVEMDINPMIVGEGDNILALDARVVLHDPAIPDTDLPKSAL